ncbi:hypothetical protein MMC22_004102 [Lobaria immixta]|nr:hypothetical protein [Lobaria immixta]
MDSMVKIVVGILGENVSEEDFWYWKGILKIQSNVSTWKNPTMDKLKDYVKLTLKDDHSGLLKSETDPRRLFDAFTKLYNHHEAESVFPWAAGSIKFDEPPVGRWMKRGPYWIKVYFLHLAVKMKLHLDYIEKPQVGVTDLQLLLEFYDSFPRNPKYRFINPQDFKLRPARLSTVGKKVDKDD